jgi:hypothetical protein
MPTIAQMPAKALLPDVGADPRSSFRNPASHTKSPCAAENEATVALPKATTRVDLLRGSRLEERSSRYSASTPNVWAKAKLIWNPHSMFLVLPEAEDEERDGDEVDER